MIFNNNFKNLRITLKKKKNKFYLILNKDSKYLVMKINNYNNFRNKYSINKKMFKKKLKNYNKIMKMKKI